MSKSTKQDITDFESKLESIQDKLMINYKEQKNLMNEMKDLMTLHKKEIKKASKNIQTNAGKLSGFNKPEKIPSKLKNLLNIKESTMPRSKVTQLLYQYFKDNKMLSQKIIIPNRQIKTIFNMNNNDEITFYNLQTWLKKVYDCEEKDIKLNMLKLDI